VRNLDQRPIKRLCKLILQSKGIFSELSHLVASLDGSAYLTGSTALGCLRDAQAFLRSTLEQVGGDGLKAEDLEKWTLTRAEQASLLRVLARLRKNRLEAEAQAESEQAVRYTIKRKHP
jgi:hypothetical protein